MAQHQFNLYPEDVKHDPGGRVRLPLLPGVRGHAEFSVCQRYRYCLMRYWNEPIGRTPYVLWIGMNPSTAEAGVDDPTIRKEMKFTRAWGFSGYVKCNVMDYRATSPSKLLEWGVVPVSNENFGYIKQFAGDAALIVAAWGALSRPLRYFAASVEQMLGDRTLMCLGVTKGGSPRHPLYVRGDTKPVTLRASRLS